MPCPYHRCWAIASPIRNMRSPAPQHRKRSPPPSATCDRPHHNQKAPLGKGGWGDRSADAKKPGFYEKSSVWQSDIYAETRFLGSSRVSPNAKFNLYCNTHS